MIILGVDPGYDRLGVAVLKKELGAKEVILFSDCILTDKKNSFESRLLVLGGALRKVIAKWEPTHLAIEKLFFTKNQKTAMDVAETRGVILYLAAEHGLSIHEYTPGQIKAAVTGYGSASKEQVALMVTKLIAIPHKPKYDDEYDALAAALTGSATIRL
ncbi:MAG: crossover junction endodeoxyribonuclease RuvC [Patescibacteria group bacterium]